MDTLRIYRGTETESRISEDQNVDVISIETFITRRENRLSRTVGQPVTAVTRAEALHRNRCCRFCTHPVVDPVFLNDGIRDGSGQYVPGSATLVGFHCERCHAEWPIFGE